jgi:methylmalonyl-CoA/ethylmalonyl-CoA epimerase
MTMNRIDHTAIVVRDLDEAIPRHEQLYGVKCRERHIVPEQGVEVAFLPIGDTQLELIAPLDSSSGVARFLETHGEGLHHIAVLVDDIRAELARLQAQGVRLIDTEPRANFHGLIAFVHPKGTGGVLLELVQARE